MSGKVILHKSIFIAVAVILLSNFPSLAQDTDSTGFHIEKFEEMDKRFDWVVDIRVSDSNYLNYAGSTLSPLTKLSIRYRLNPHFGGDAGSLINYEELWYHKDQAIGCRRLRDLNIPTTLQGGAIRVIPSVAAAHNGDAISGGIARLVLDIGLRQAVLDAVFIPKQAFQPVIDDLARFNFLPAARISPNMQPIELPFFSDPLGSSCILYLCPAQ